MNRVVHHHAYIGLGHRPVCDVLAQDAITPLVEATQAAAAFASRIAHRLDNVSEFFDVDENVRVTASPLRHHRTADSLNLSWLADPNKRLLPNVTATLEILPIVARGPEAITELILHGEYSPPPRPQRTDADFFLERRVVNATLHAFLDNLVSAIERRVESPSG